MNGLRSGRVPFVGVVCARCGGDGTYESDVSLPYDVECGTCRGVGWLTPAQAADEDARAAVYKRHFEGPA